MWTRNTPESPAKGFDSLWFWYWADGEKQPIVMEIWPLRDVKRFKGFWWSIALPKPEEKLPSKLNKPITPKVPDFHALKPVQLDKEVIGEEIRRGSGLL